MDDLETKLAARLGKAIREHRTRLQLSQAELAENLDATPEFISLIERGERLPSLGTLAGMAEVFGVSPGTLLDAHAPPSHDDDPALALLRQLPKASRPAAIGVLRSMVAEYRRKRPAKRR